MTSTVGGVYLREASRELMALHDPDLALQGLVRRLRASVGCDLAYLSLNDPVTRFTEIRFSDGVRTPDYSAIRMPIGTGVLGMAAAGVTTESSDYLRDVGKLHIPSVDDAVAGEAVAAILSTPLRSGDDVIGTLTIANRTPGAFDSEQKQILEDAALIGSIAVDLFDLRRQLRDERLGGTARDEQLRVSSAFAHALAQGHGSARLLEIASEAVQGQVTIEVDDEAEAQHRVPLEAGGAIRVETAQVDADSVLGTISTFVSISLLYETAIEEARHLRQSELVERLIEPPSDPAARPLRSGLPGDGDLLVKVLRVLDPNVRRSLLAESRAAVGREALIADHRGQVVIVSRRGRVSPGALGNLAGLGRFFGGSAVAMSDSRIPLAFEEATRVARSMQTLGRPGVIASRDDLGVVAFALGTDVGSAERLVDSYLAPLLGGSNRDRRLLTTALTFLDAHSSVSQTAAALGVHENTVRQRLDRLDVVLPRWRDGTSTLDVHVALRTYALLTTSDRDPET